MRRLLAVGFFVLVPLKARCSDAIPLTLVLVPEQDACAGGSYLKNGSCSSVSVEQVQQWLENHAHLSTTLRTGSHAIALTPAFFKKLRLLVDYDGFPPPDTEGRWSIVLLFKILPPASRTVTLKRLQANGIDETITHLAIGKGGHALTHQRADAFKPLRNVAWQLDVGGNEYRFWMKKP
jgi:hypothetical protein